MTVLFFRIVSVGNSNEAGGFGLRCFLPRWSLMLPADGSSYGSLVAITEPDSLACRVYWSCFWLFAGLDLLM